MDDFCGGPFWDQDLSWATTNPDVTFCFQQTALVYIPCALLWVFAPLEIVTARRSRYNNIPWNLLNITKSIVLVLLIALSFIDFSMARYHRETQGLFPVHSVTPIIKIVTFALAAGLLLLHKMRGIRSSGLMFTFWLLLLLFAIPQLRSEIMTFNDRANFLDDMEWADYQFYSYMVYMGLLVFNLVLNCFADAPAQFTSYTKPSKPTPEMSASFLRKLLFQWFDVMTWRGYRRPLEIEDMWDVSPDNTSKELNPPFEKYWKQSVEKARRKQATGPKDSKEAKEKTNGSILPAMVKAFGGPFWFAGVLRLLMDLLQFASPFLLRELIGFTGSDAAMWKGFLFTGALFGVFIVMALLNGQYMQRTSMVGFRIRAALINSIYRKAMCISNNAKNETTVGEIVNLMAVDARNFFDLIPYLHYLWSGPLVVGLALYFLYDILGPSVFAGIGTMLLLVPLTAIVTQQMTKLQTAQMKVKDERVKVMNEILNGIKVLKLYAWEPSFEASVLKKRSKEISILKAAAVYDAVLNFVWTMSPFIVSLASFAVFVLVDSNNVLTPEIAFVSLTLFNILGFPLTLFSMMISFAIQCFVSVKRINKFLNSEELNPDNVMHKSSASAIEISGDAMFTWGGEHTTLKSINLAVKKQDLVAVVGKVGSGKSSLVAAILGEMEKISGTVNTDGRIAYVSQQAWIQNATLQDNITFGREFNEEFYKKVVAACALKSDIEMLPGGDQTEIGEKGINLSGGQKQRVSLARAVYSRADIYLLDDPLSAVDPHVGKHIFEQVIGPEGLLVGKTRFLVTHGVAFLPFMDEILVMLNGEISESGSYKSLLAQKGAFSEFLEEHMQKGGEDVEKLKDIEELEILEQEISVATPKIEATKPVLTDDRTKLLQDASKLIEKEEAAVGSVGLSIYVQYIKNIGFGLAGLALIFNILVQAFAIYGNIWLSEWSEDPEAGTDISVRNLYLGVYGALGGGQALSLFAGSLFLAIGCLNAARSLHNKLLNSSLKFPMSFFDTTPLGRIMNRFSKEVEMVDNTLPMTLRVWILMVFNVLGVFGVITYSTPWFAVVIVPMFVIYYFIQRFYVATSRQLKRLESVTSSPIYSHFGESINGQSTIRAYGEETRFTRESQAKVDGNQMTSYPSIIANCWLGVRLELIGALVVLFASLFAVLGRENISPGVAGLSITYALQISQVLSFLVSLTAEVETNVVAIERMEEYAGMPQEAAWKKGEVDPEWPREGKVEFHDFKLRYRDGLDLVLKGLTFSVSGGEKIGIVGRTGAGKSSLTLALFRLIEAAGGRINIDGKNIADMGLHSLRLRLTIIPQDPVLFSGTLRMNIDPFDAYSDDEIWRVLEHSHLKVFVKGQSAGLLYDVAESGENLSVGQRQLVCLARALLRKTKVLILDEATAAVDLETDDLIQKTIRSEFKDCTVLTIAHRLNTILDSDRVLVLDKGEIAEFDSPESLLQNPDSIFYSMAKDAGISGISSLQDAANQSVRL